MLSFSALGFSVMIPRMKNIVAASLTACVVLALCAITSRAVKAQETACKAPVRIEAKGPRPAPLVRVKDYRSIFRECHNGKGEMRLAIRSMSIEAKSLLLVVEPSSLATRLEPERCWSCAETDDAAQKNTRFLRAIHTNTRSGLEDANVQTNAGLSHGTGDGSFITGDLCPSRKPLDREFFQRLAGTGPRTPIALAVSGLWITRHRADFNWLRDQASSNALEITWINHSYHHPFVPGRRHEANFLLTPGVDIDSEILDTERLLLANGATPSVFFRFPGLVSDAAAIEAVRQKHLVVLGADGWLAFGSPLRPGAIVLVHPNGNEPDGLTRFSKLLESGKLPRPFRPIDEAP
jgi:hypothetical protein